MNLRARRRALRRNGSIRTDRFGLAKDWKDTATGFAVRMKASRFTKTAIITTGVYGLKITDTKTGKVHFQGKFKVNKLPVPKEDIKTLFYVENEWMLPIGYVGFEKDRTDYDIQHAADGFFLVQRQSRQQ